VVFALFGAWSFSAVGVITRKLQNIHFSTTLTTYAILGSIFLFLILVIESLASWTAPRLFTDYSSSQFGWIVLASAVNLLALILNILASQNGKTAIIQVLHYMALIYAFLADFFVFNEKFENMSMQLIGVGIVLFFTITMVVYNAFGIN
jgi:EamA domain-containing membrane protein RarD